MSYTPNQGFESTDNTTTVALAGGATFTGTAEKNSASDVMVSCKADAAGTLYFDFSVDGTNWETFPTGGFEITAGIHEFHTAVKGPRHFRVRLVNGAAAQTSLRLTTYFGVFRQPSAPLNQASGLDSDAILVRPTLPWLDIGRGLQSGIRGISKFGRNSSVGTSFEPVCLGGIYNTPQAASATTLRIKSGGDANDTAAGSGAREVTLQGLDETFTEVTETIATAGASASSATTTTFTRVFRAWVSASGTYASAAAGSHSGDIVIENGSGGTDWLTLDTASGFPIGQSEIGMYSVGDTKTAYVKLRQASADSTKKFDLIFFHRGNADETAAPYTAMRAKSVVVGIEGGNLGQYAASEVPFGPFEGPCDLGFMAKVSSGTAELSVEFEIIEVNK